MDPARSEPAPEPLRPLRDQVGDLYAGHVDAVLNILRLRGVPASEREDLAHDVFVRVQEAWARCRSQGAPRPWIAEIARNVARNHQQAQQKHAVLAYDEDLTSVASSEDDAERGARIDLVRRLLQEIHDDTRREIVTRHLEGQTNEEIAAALNLPLPRVAKQFQRGYAELLDARDRHDARERHEARRRNLAVVIPLFGATSLFEGLLDGAGAPEGFKARGWARLVEHSGGGGDGPSSPAIPPVPASAAALPWASVLAIVACAVAVIDLAILVALLARPPRPSPAASIEARPDPAAAVVDHAPAPSSTPSSSALLPPPAPVLPSFTARPAPPVTPSREHDVIDRAKRALDHHDGPAALAALDDHARDFPQGALAECRERLRIEARSAARRSEGSP